MGGTNEAFSRVEIDAQLKDQGWDVLNPNAVRFEYVLPDRTKADYVLCDRHGRSRAVIEAKKAAINPAQAEAQAKADADRDAVHLPRQRRGNPFLGVAAGSLQGPPEEPQHREQLRRDPFKPAHWRSARTRRSLARD